MDRSHRKNLSISSDDLLYRRNESSSTKKIPYLSSIEEGLLLFLTLLQNTVTCIKRWCCSWTLISRLDLIECSLSCCSLLYSILLLLLTCQTWKQIFRPSITPYRKGKTKSRSSTSILHHRLLHQMTSVFLAGTCQVRAPRVWQDR
jgi:hypothetical protein